MARDCFAKIDLASVSYKGSDIGDDWDFAITVAPPAVRTVIPLHQLKHNTTKIYNLNLVNRAIGRCDPGPRFQFKIVAKENDRVVDDIVTHRVNTPQYKCPDTLFTTQFFTQFRVVEKRPWIMRWLPQRVAILEFTFDVQLQCIEL